jgi:hypothetical protein
MLWLQVVLFLHKRRCFCRSSTPSTSIGRRLAIGSFIAVGCVAAAGCGGGSSPTQPTGPALTWFTLPHLRLATVSSGDEVSQSLTPQVANVMLPIKIFKLRVKVEGFDNCPEQHQIAIQVADKEKTVWDHGTRFPCNFPSTLRLGTVPRNTITYIDNVEMDDFNEMSYYSTFSAISRGGNNSNEILVTISVLINSNQ